MKMRKFFHIVAVMLSSFTSMITHAKAQETTTAREKKGEGEVTRHHKHHSGALGTSGETALTDPPRRAKIRSLSADDIKNSRHAATWSSYAAQEGDEPAAHAPGPPISRLASASAEGAQSDAPPAKLNPALMASAERPIAPLVTVIESAPLPPPLPGDEQSRYPWKRRIVTTTFWVGETPTQNNPVPNDSSCWDPHWAKNYGGNDTPAVTQRTSAYIPASFIPSQNPFYIALPYNDMEHGAHKAEAPQVIPWFPKEYKGPSQSVCQGRWVAIRFGSKVCYAQWEDAGPFCTDHWQYVFGNERPRPNLNGGAGLDVSPAVRDFLGMNSTDVTDWKFVEFEEVPTGPWARFGDNNTFVQNARKPSGEVAQNILDPLPAALRGIMPGKPSPTVEIR